MNNKQSDEGEAYRNLENERDEQSPHRENTKRFKEFLEVAEELGAIDPWLLEYFSRKDKPIRLNVQDAIKRFIQAAEQCNAVCYEALGDLYFKREGATQDYPEAYKWAVKGLKFADQQLNLEESDYKDEEGEEDDADILDLYRKMSEKDFENEMDFGEMNRDGKLGKQETNEVIQMYREAAAGTSCGEYDMRLGDIYREGELVEQDMKMACKWYGEAARKGEVQAIPYLEEHFKKSLKKTGGL